MPLMYEHALKVLEFDKIIEILKRDTSSSLGADVLARTKPIHDRERIVKLLRQTTELATLLLCHDEFCVWGLSDVRPSLHQAKVDGAMLSPQQLLEIRDFLDGSVRVRNFVLNLAAEFPNLAERAEALVPLPQLAGAIGESINDGGEVVDDATPKLRGLRRSLREVRRRILSTLEGIVQSEPFLVQEAVVTRRNDRYVIPLRPDFRKHIRGIVHDRSSSGATVFVEPEHVVPLNDKLLQVRRDEEQEVCRILRRLTGEVRAARDTILLDAEIMGEFDALMAKARYSIRHGCVEPVITTEPFIRLRQARHPLLLEQSQQGSPVAEGQTRPVVPIDVEVGTGFHTLLITGPNTGGKTVALKTLGLLCSMAQAGMHIPAGDGSEVGVFREILADIGDEQSIEQNLSTFSSHVTQIRDILDRADGRSLVLLDELGAGTDPSEGAALGIAILEALHARGTRVVAATHHNAIKVFVYEQGNMANASVEFDTDTLSPLYTLTIGVPGRSKALEIAGRLGLPEPVLLRAREELLEEHGQVEGILEQLEADLGRVRDERASLLREQEAVRQIKEEYVRLRSEVRAEKNALKRTFRREVKDFLVEGRREIAEAINAVLFSKSGGNEAWRRMDFLEDRAGAMLDSERLGSPLAKHEIREGQRVRILSLDLEGVVVEVPRSGDVVGVQVGKRRLEVPLKELGEVAGEMTAAVHSPEKGGGYHVELRSNGTEPGVTIRVIGEPVEEALPKVDEWVDRAFVRRIPEVRVIHGGGRGRLRRAIADMLGRHPHVKSCGPAEPWEGGQGVTVVTLDL